VSVRITDTWIKSALAEAEASGRRIEVSDAVRRGLVIRVSTARVAVWSVQYRPRGERGKRRATLGRYRQSPTSDGLSIAEARSEAARLLTAIHAGRDPAMELKAERQRVNDELVLRRQQELARAARATMGELVEAFTADQARRGVKSRSENARSLNKELRPLRSLAVADVRPAMIDSVIRQIEDRGSPTEAARFFGRLSTLFQFAVSLGHIESSPLDKVPARRANNVRTRFLAPHELRAFILSLATMPLSGNIRRILQLQLLLGARVSEVAGMEKGEIDLVDGHWRIDAERSKNGSEHLLPLPPEARRVIEGAISASTHQRYVFPNVSGSAAIRADTIAQSLSRVQALFGFTDARSGDPNPFTSHDLRRTCATYIEALGFPEKLVASILNHKSKKEATVTGRVYTQAEMIEQMHIALTSWEGALRKIAGGTNPFAIDIAARRARELEIVGCARPLVE